MLDTLSLGDLSKHEQILEMEYTYCMNLLLFWKIRDEYHEEMNRIQSKLK